MGQCPSRVPKRGNNIAFIILLVEIFRGDIYTLSPVISHVLIPQVVEDFTGGHLLGLRLAARLPHCSSSTRFVVFFPPG